jgi:hypothetical protein
MKTEQSKSHLQMFRRHLRAQRNEICPRSRFLTLISKEIKMKKVVKKYCWEMPKRHLRSANSHHREMPTWFKSLAKMIVKIQRNLFPITNRLERLKLKSKRNIINPKGRHNLNKIEIGKPCFNYCWSQMLWILFWDFCLSKVVQVLTFLKF